MEARARSAREKNVDKARRIGNLLIGFMLVRTGGPDELQGETVFPVAGQVVLEKAVLAAQADELALPPGEVRKQSPADAVRIERILDPVVAQAAIEVLSQQALEIGVAAPRVAADARWVVALGAQQLRAPRDLAVLGWGGRLPVAGEMGAADAARAAAAVGAGDAGKPQLGVSGVADVPEILEMGEPHEVSEALAAEGRALAVRELQRHLVGRGPWMGKQPGGRKAGLGQALLAEVGLQCERVVDLR